MASPLHYTVSAPEPFTHHFHVSVTIPDAPPAFRLLFPRWTPGSYLLREHGRQAENIRLVGEGNISKISPHQWEVRSKGGEVTVQYRVYAHELTVRTAHLDDTHGFFNGVNLFMVPEGGESRPCILKITPPAGWKISTTLPQKDATTFEADDFHHLVDCPVEMGTHRVLPFTVQGIPHEVILWNHGNENEQKLVEDLPKLVEQNAKVFGGLPYKRYLFITHLTDSGRGGLEHRDSTALLFPRFGFKDKDYEDFLTLACHEHFHTWNVKRIKPRVFAPYDYTRENATRMLWAMEGFTSYYDNFNTRRAGLITADRYLTVLGELITQLMQTPGRKLHSLEESSFDAWIKYYRQDEHSVNSTVSYYLKGELVGACLDLTLRQLTNGRGSLDDVMRLLWKWTSDRGEGLDEDAVEQAAAEVAGKSLKPFFDHAVRSTEELPLKECLAYAGLELVFRHPESADDKGGTPGKNTGGTRPYFGASVKRDGSLSSVVPHGPASRAGLVPGDQLVSIGRFRVNDGSFAQRLEEQKPGASVLVHYFRRDELRSTEVALADPVQTVAYIKRNEKAAENELALRKAWLQE